MPVCAAYGMSGTEVACVLLPEHAVLHLLYSRFWHKVTGIASLFCFEFVLA